MKKLNYLLLGAAGLLMASCANDDLQAPGTGDGLQITINLCADPSTRADAEIPTGMTLNYAVYDSENTLVEEGSTTFTGTSTTFNTNLLSGKDYTLAFFAQVTDYKSAYTFSAEGKSVTANYGVMTDMDAFNSGGYDCFYGTYAYPASGAAGSISVTLYRPVAQVNWGTNDLTGKIAETFPTVYSTLQTEAYKQFNLLNGEMSGKEKVTLGPVQAPTVSYPTVGTGSYTYVGMQYLLATNTSEVYDFNLAISNNNGTTPGETVDLVVTSAPLQANYKTNIYGSLLTDNVNLNIELAEWGGSILDPQELGDEIDNSGLYLNQTTKTYFITSVSALQKMAEISQTTTLQNYKMVLTTDLDMKGQSYNTYIKNSLGTFDGQGHTISNLTITGTDYVGFFSQGLGTIQNVTFENANVTGNHYVAIVAGYGANAQFNNITIKGGSVTTTPQANGSTYKYGDKAGAITGYLSGEDGTASVTNCSVSGVNVTGYKMIGSIVGYANIATNYPKSVCNIQNNTASDCIVTANQNFDGTYESTNVPFDAGEICGYYATGTTQSNNTATNVSLTTISSEGTYGISTPAAWILHGKKNNSRPGNGVLQLNQDLDFNGATIENFFFAGTFNGNGYKISNVTITSTDAYSMGLFNRDAIAGTLTVNDVTLENVYITNPDTGQGYVGVICGDIQNNSTVNLNNVHVINANLKGVKATGGLVGMVAAGCTLNISGCSVSDSYLTNFSVNGESGYVCGMVGRVNPSGTINFKGTDNIVSDTKIEGYWATKRGEASISAVAAQYNASGGTINDLSNVKVENVTVTPIAIGD